jgi:hypothetical protein
MEMTPMDDFSRRRCEGSHLGSLGAILRRCNDAGSWACLGVHTRLAAYVGWAGNRACICYHNGGTDKARGEMRG